MPLSMSRVFPIAFMAALLTVGGPATSAQGQPPSVGANRATTTAPVAEGATKRPAGDETTRVPDAAQPSGVPGGGSLDLPTQAEQLVSPKGLTSTLNLLVLFTLLSLAPSALIMTTCFIRFIVIFGLLRQALGTQQLPPNQVLIGLSLFLTFAVMAPVWEETYDKGIRPYTHPAPGQVSPSLDETFRRSVAPTRRYMSEQIERTGNSDAVWMFLEFEQRHRSGSVSPDPPSSYDDVSLSVLLPAFLLSELKTAFIIGAQIYIPFLVLDMVVAVILTSMGMMMMPPTLVSFPFKLMLFVLIDGWFLTVGMMLESVRPPG